MFSSCNVVQTSDDLGVFILLPKYERVQDGPLLSARTKREIHVPQCTCARCIKHWTSHTDGLVSRISDLLRAKSRARYRSQTAFDSFLPPLYSPGLTVPSQSVISSRADSRRGRYSSADGYETPRRKLRVHVKVAEKASLAPQETAIRSPTVAGKHNEQEAAVGVAPGSETELVITDEPGVSNNEENTEQPAQEVVEAEVVEERPSPERKKSIVADRKLSIRRKESNVLVIGGAESEGQSVEVQFPEAIMRVLALLGTDEDLPEDHAEVSQNPSGNVSGLRSGSRGALNASVANANAWADLGLGEAEREARRREQEREEAQKNWEILKTFAVIANQIRQREALREQRLQSLRRTVSLLNIIKPLLRPRQRVMVGSPHSSQEESLGEDMSFSEAEASPTGREDAQSPTVDLLSMMEPDKMKVLLRAVTQKAAREAFEQLLEEPSSLSLGMLEAPAEADEEEEDCEPVPTQTPDDPLPTRFVKSPAAKHYTEELLRVPMVIREREPTPSPLFVQEAPQPPDPPRPPTTASTETVPPKQTHERKRHKRPPPEQRVTSSAPQKPLWKEIAVILTKMTGRKRLQLVSSLALDLRHFSSNAAVLEKVKKLQAEKDDKVKFDEFFEDPAYRYAYSRDFEAKSAVSGLNCDFFGPGRKKIRLYKGLPEWARKRYAPETGSRFTLPNDRRQLERMTPLEYLSRHCIVANDRVLLYHKVYSSHRSYGEAWLNFEKLSTAMKDLYGTALDASVFNNAYELLGLNSASSNRFDFKTFTIIAGFFERLFYKRLSRSVKFFKDEIERADFYTFAVRLRDLRISDHLRKLIDLIFC